ncbi:hypothetical protein KW796_01885 [Candidatus Parcubacteria bacterium]|nr:hypothetical protein [Candidatus Parcubacteria bacterium]
MTTTATGSPGDVMTALTPSRSRSWAGLMTQIEERAEKYAEERPRHRYATCVWLCATRKLVPSGSYSEEEAKEILERAVRQSFKAWRIDICDDKVEVRIMETQNPFSLELTWNSPVPDRVCNVLRADLESIASASESSGRQARSLLSRLNEK